VASNASESPVIGLTTYLEQATQGVWDVRAAFLPQVYFDSVTASGGIAVLLPPQHSSATGVRVEDAADAVLDGLDGLILTGGLDVQPELYGAERHPTTDPARPDRDAWELALFRGAEERRMPVLAICRGLQLVNVARGGTLHQHILNHRQTPVAPHEPTHAVSVTPGSPLHRLTSRRRLAVNTFHHQAIDRLGEGLEVIGTAPDGTIEAVCDPAARFHLGVQWHAEVLTHRPEHAAVTRALVDAAARPGLALVA